MTPNGNNVFFLTSAGLSPQDLDGVGDVYDAREKGGFPSMPASREPCEGDACQGPLTNPAPLLVPGSVVQVPENAASPAKIAPSKLTRTISPQLARALQTCMKKPKRKRAACKRAAQRKYAKASAGRRR